MQEQNANSLAKGFTPPAEELERHLLLTIGELVEAHEELRKGFAPDHVYFREADGKPEGFTVEVADAFIRLCHVMGDLERKYPGLDMTKVILEKFAFNKTRPFRHGKAF